MRLAVVGLALVAASAVEARNFPQAEYDHKTKWIISAGLQNGGDTLQQVIDVGTGEVVEKLKAGGFFNVRIGGVMALGEASDWSVEMTAGYLYDEVNSNINVNDNAKFERATVEVIPFYNFGRQRVGLGATYHFSPKFEQTAGVGNVEVEFDDAVGGILQYDVMYNQQLSVGFRASYIQYELGSLSVDAPSFGMHINYQF
jgi:hypothetical protein